MRSPGHCLADAEGTHRQARRLVGPVRRVPDDRAPPPRAARHQGRHSDPRAQQVAAWLPGPCATTVAQFRVTAGAPCPTRRMRPPGCLSSTPGAAAPSPATVVGADRVEECLARRGVELGARAPGGRRAGQKTLPGSRPAATGPGCPAASPALSLSECTERGHEPAQSRGGTAPGRRWPCGAAR